MDRIGIHAETTPNGARFLLANQLEVKTLVGSHHDVSETALDLANEVPGSLTFLLQIPDLKEQLPIPIELVEHGEVLGPCWVQRVFNDFGLSLGLLHSVRVVGFFDLDCALGAHGGQQVHLHKVRCLHE